MRLLKDLHTHSVYSDGVNTIEEMVLKAIESGMAEIGISDHSYTFFDESYCMNKDKKDEYISEVRRIKEKYKDAITVRCGVEQDYYSEEAACGFDYVIGSVHYIKVRDSYFEIDGVDTSIVDDIHHIVKLYFDDDIYKFIAEYFDTVSDVVNKTGCDIIGHFDIISKFNEKRPFFDENDPQYIAAWKKAADHLIPYNIPFEINLSALRKGYRSQPYPAYAIQEYIRSKGGSFILSSDSHDIFALSAEYDKNSIFNLKI